MERSDAPVYISPCFCCQNIDEHFSTFGSEVRKISHNKVHGIFGRICCMNIDKHLFCRKHLLFFSTSIPLLTDAFSTQKILIFFQYIYKKYQRRFLTILSTGYLDIITSESLCWCLEKETKHLIFPRSLEFLCVCKKWKDNLDIEKCSLTVYCSEKHLSIFSIIWMQNEKCICGPLLPKKCSWTTTAMAFYTHIWPNAQNCRAPQKAPT